MTNSHLTDETLQAYILKEIQGDTVARQIKSSPESQKRLEEYQHLMENLKKVEPESFSFDVTALVMEKIIAAKNLKQKNAYIVMYIIFSILSTIALFLLYPYIKTIFAQFKSFSIMTNALVLVSGLGVAIFLLNDLFWQYRRKEMLLCQ